MYQALKRTTSWFILLLICYNTVGYFFVFNFQVRQAKSEIKRSIKESVPEAQLVLIRISPDNCDEITWIHSKEFRYRGSMYDIVRLRTISDVITDYYCIEDVKEAGLFRHLNTLVSDLLSGNGQQARIKSLFTAFLAGLFPPPSNENDMIRNNEPLVYSFISELYAFLHTHQVLQPPKF